MRSATSVADEEALVLEFLRAQAGFRVSDARRSELSARIEKLRKRLEVGEGELVRRLESDRQLFDELVTEMTVGETYFLRDPVQLEIIRKVVLPSLISSRQNLRVWSAGCSTGEEAYSLAILLEQEGLSARSTILATDISRVALERAAKGVFKPWSFRKEDPSLAPYFSRHGKSQTVCERIRRRVRFAYLNLASDEYPALENGTALIDLLMCRNVLIYLDESAIKAVASRFYECLSDGGWLITGPSDPPLWNLAPFTAELVDGAVLYRKQKPKRSCARSKGPARVGEGLRSKSRPSTVSTIERTLKAFPIAESAQSIGGAERQLSAPEAWSQRVMEVARTEGPERAAAVAADAIARHPSSTSLRYLHSLLMVALAKDDEAQDELRRLIYLDRSLAVVHFTLATLLQRRGDLGRARRMFENAYRICAAQAPSEIVPLSEGTSAGALAASAKAQIARLASAGRA